MGFYSGRSVKMAGRGLVEAADTIPNPRILTTNKNGYLLIAKEPLHFYEPELTGLDCELSILSKHFSSGSKVIDGFVNALRKS